MATPSNSSGLLSKVARFVRNPTTDWSDLDKSGPEVSTGHNKQALKNMIERKRHDDNVRKREFDHLRKLRRSMLMVTPEMASKVSIFRGTTNYSDLGERADTLKKIDEIEAQMSRQWWKGHPHSAPGPSGVSEPTALRQSSPSSRGQTSDICDFVPTQAMPDSTDDVLTMMGATSNDAKSLLNDPTTIGSHQSPSRDVAASKLFAVELGGSLSDPDLEEASIRFANGDDSGAEAVLLAVLAPGNVFKEVADVWAEALFDLYRCTGQQAGFKRWALDYVRRFDKPPPIWFSTPQQIGLTAKTTAADAVVPQEAKLAEAKSSTLIWQCPAHLNVGALDKLKVGHRQSVSTWSLDWSNLQQLTPGAAEELASLFAQWCDQPVSLYCEGVPTLIDVVRSATPVGVRQIAPFWWSLRFDMFRMLHLQDDFELSALDYCVTFEISPPSWRDVHCTRLYQMPQANPTVDGNGPVFAQGDEWCDTAAMTSTALPAHGALPVGRVELTGELRGDASDILISLETMSHSTQQIVISCRRLIRVDFSAAGSILNWAAHGQALGCHIEFREVPTLVAAFFNLIGINEHAQIMARKH